MADRPGRAATPARALVITGPPQLDRQIAARGPGWPGLLPPPG